MKPTTVGWYWLQWNHQDHSEKAGYAKPQIVMVYKDEEAHELRARGVTIDDAYPTWSAPVRMIHDEAVWVGPLEIPPEIK